MSTPPVTGDSKALGLTPSSATEMDKPKVAGVAPKGLEIGKDIIDTPEESSCCFSYLCCIPQAILNAICSIWNWVFGSGSAKGESKPGDAASDPRIQRETLTVAGASSTAKVEVRTLSDATLREALKEKNRDLLFKCTTLSSSKEVFPLHELLAAKEYDLMVELIKKGKCSLNQVDQEGNTLLHLLCRMGDDSLAIKVGPKDQEIELFRWLLAQGVDVDFLNKAGQSPLLIACSQKAYKCAKNLAPLVMYPRVKDQMGDTAAHLLAAAGASEAFNALVSNTRAKPSLNVWNNDKQTLLHVICRNTPVTAGHLAILSTVCADKDTMTVADQQDKEGNTALHYACKFGSAEAVKVLLKAGAHTDVQDSEGNTALLLLAKNPMHLEPAVQAEIATLLMQNDRTDVLAKDKQGFAVIHYIAENGAHDLLGAIVTAKPGIDLGVNEQGGGEMGIRPLHIAVTARQATMTSSLIRYLNADKAATDSAGRSATDYANYLEKYPEVRSQILGILRDEVYIAPPADPVPAAEAATAPQAPAAPAETVTVHAEADLTQSQLAAAFLDVSSGGESADTKSEAGQATAANPPAEGKAAETEL